MNSYTYRYAPYSIPTSMHVMHPYAPLPAGQVSQIVHTDDAGTKLSDRVKRKCYNCHSTDTSTWRRSSLAPGKVLCNKCGLYERTHSKPRPEKFSHKRKSLPPFTTKPYHATTVSRPRMQSISHYPISSPPHHYEYSPLLSMAPRPDSQGSPYSHPSYPSVPSSVSSGSPPGIRSLLSGSSPDMVAADPRALPPVVSGYDDSAAFTSSDGHPGYQTV